MNQRERLLVFGLAAIVGGWILISVVRSRLIEPLRQRDEQIVGLQDQVYRKETDLLAAQRAASELTGWRHVALPADDSVAQTLYLDAIRRMLVDAGIDRPSLRPGRPMERAGIFTRLPINIEARCDLDKITAFLRAFEQAPMLHQVRRLRIQPVVVNDKIEAFDLSMAIEAVSMEDAFAKDALPTPESLAKAFGDRPQRGEGDFSLFAKKNPFQPTLIVRQSAGPKSEGESDADSDERGDCYISATLYVDGNWELWMTRKSSQQRTVVRQGEQIKVGGMTADVVRIEPDAVYLKVGDKMGSVSIGANLSSFRPEDAESAPAESPASDS